MTGRRPSPHGSPRLLTFVLTVAGLATAGLAAQLYAPPSAAAHLGRISYSDLSVEGAQVLYRLKFAAHLAPGIDEGGESKVTRQQVLALEDDVEHWLTKGLRLGSGGRACPLSIENIIGPDRNDDLQVIVLFECAAPVTSLRLTFEPFDATLGDYENIVSVRMDGRSWSYVFAPGSNFLKIGEEPLTSAAAGAEAQPGRFRSFLMLGIEHILEGYDHLLFLLALLLLGGSVARLAGIVTAFTVAHSITLSLAALDLVSLPPRPVEIVVALSIMYVAAENLVVTKADHRWVVTFLFGLVHGFAFAGILREAGLPAGGILVPLLAFNLGVEAGQCLVVVLVVPLLHLLLRGPRERPLQVLLSGLILVLAAFWAYQRTLAVL